MSDKASEPIEDRLQSDNCARALRALANAERLKLVQCLQQRPHTVTELTERLESNITKVSHHLSVLRHAGLVHDDKQGKFVVYSLDAEIFRSDGGKALDVMDLGCCRVDLRPQS
ncbi:MAG TPA: metalloregulator ArsR/SmtB family transcription factor [Gemmataceae bacterium]|nr:metalloregulator ArsR/SmtB family transcription factor [Gemmataceae bacterium]